MDDGQLEHREFRSLAGSAPTLLVVAAATVLVLTIVAVASLRDARRDTVRAEAHARNTEVAAALAAAVNLLGGVVDGLSASVAASGPAAIDRAPLPGLRSVRYLPEVADPQSLGELEVDGIDLAALRPTLDQARDGVDSVLMARPVGDPPSSVLVDVLYRRDDGSLSRRPSVDTTAARRSQLAGFVLAVVDLDAVLPPAPAERWTLTDGSIELRGAGGPIDDGVRADADVLGRRWSLSSAVVSPRGIAASQLAALLLALTALVLIVAAARQAVTMLRRRSDEAEVARRRASAIVTLSGVVQQSHDLGEILPGLSVQLADTLGLDGLTLSLATPAGTMREIFAHGARPDNSGAAMIGDRTEVAAGETLILHLHRAERSIAVLRVVTGRVLDAGDLDLLNIAGELITSTVVTARSSEQQQEAVARLRALDELKTAFLGTASHELRTPVTAISGFSFVLAERWESLSEAERRVFAERIASNARALDALVQDLLDFARLERGDHAIVLEPVDLSELVRQTLERLAPVWQGHRIDQNVDAECWVKGDRASLERIITNLVSNAVKFSPAGGAVGITVRRGDDIELVVDDEGPGVPPDEREKIFVRFFRGSSQAVMRTRGVGIGLSVVEDFVLRMGGRIDVAESPAGGARFTVALTPAPASSSRVPARDSGSEDKEEHDVASP